jgi:hypothetical protein
MARLSTLPQIEYATLQRDLPIKDRIKLAISWLKENPTETPTTAARCFRIEKEDSVRKAWLRAKRDKKPKGGENRILTPDMHEAVIRYAADQATNGGKGATKQMLFNCIMHLRKEEGKSIPTWRWFQIWLSNTHELHVIKTKPIANHRVNIHTEKDLREWFELKYRPALEYTGIKSGTYIHNMDEKGARLAVPAGEEVVVPIGITEMYVGIPENRLSLTVIESISANGKAIPPVVILPGKCIMVSWFHTNMTGHEVITVSDSGYINEEICMVWLDHFIKHNNCSPNGPWHILLMDGATCHAAPRFVLTAKYYKIWIVEFPSHQTHLIQPLDVGCFRTWKHYQQCALMNAIRSFEAEYLIQSFFRDLPQIREKTFTKSTIKHSFRNSGMWPMSFKQVKRKLKEYGRKSKKDTGLEFLEYSGSDSDSEKEDELLPELQITEEYQLPLLLPSSPPPRLQAPTSYFECRNAIDDLQPKISAGLSSPSRKKNEVIMTATKSFLMRGSIHEMEINNANTAQLQVHKNKLSARKSIQKGGSRLACEALDKIKDKIRKEAENKLKKARTAITRTENKAKNQLKDRGIQARKDEKARLNYLKEQQPLGTYIPPEMLLPIRDPEKQPTEEEKEALRANPALYDYLAQMEKEWQDIQSEDPRVFIDIPIDPQLLIDERQFLVPKNPLDKVQFEVEEEEEEEEASDVESNVSGVPPSVASIDSIAENANFVRLV